MGLYKIKDACSRLSLIKMSRS